MNIKSLKQISPLALIIVSLILYTSHSAHAQAETSLTISEENFTMYTGTGKILTATLTCNGNPVEGEYITWSVTVGTIGPKRYRTDNAGQVSVVYTAPSYETSVIVTASYAGSGQYMPSSAVAYGTIVAPPVTPPASPAPPHGISSRDIIGIAIILCCGTLVVAIVLGKI
jgi:hypothetical protein